MTSSSLVAERRVLERILDSPQLALVVPQLPPETLHRVIQACGLEDCRFLHVMQGLRALSNSRPEIDGLDDLLTDADQAMFDVRIDRERRREQRGYVAVSDARAFLEASRRFRVETVAASIVEPPSRALRAGSETQPRRLASIRAQMEFLFNHDPVAYAARMEEIAFLANTMMAGCSIQARAFTAEEASNAAVATCNLGLERSVPGNGFLVEHDLIGVFQAGWSVLHDDVAMHAAEGLADILKDVRCPDREIQAGLSALRRELVRHMRAGMPWRARDAMEVLASLDMPAWVALLGLIGECPVVHAAVAASQDSSERAVSASAFEFVSEQAHIIAVRAFMQSLREILRG